MDRNSYFEIIDGTDSVSMKVFPAEGNGEKLKIDEVTAFFDKVGVKDYDLVKVNAMITSPTETEDVISNQGCYSFGEIVSIKITPDKMFAIARFYPPSSNGSRMDKEELVKTIQNYNISFGLDEKIIDDFIANPLYCTNLIIAKGQKPVDGKDAFITYNFQTDRKAKPQLNDDGTVDFHHLNNISSVKKGEVLAVLTKEDVGVPGTDVFGQVARPKKVNKLILRAGNSTELSEDGLRLISQVNGHAVLEGDRVFVSDNFDVPNDVDNSTGDIEYSGSVTVKGNVRAGFSIKADGDVEVYGVVEGCNIDAGGDIILHRGIQGMGKSSIKAKGNLISKFIESADVEVGGYIETDTIINSNVAAEGDIYVRGKNGSLIGGNVRSTTYIEAAIIGSPMGAVTQVEVGTAPSIKLKIKTLKESIQEKTKENEKLSQILAVMRKKKDMGVLEEENVPMIAQLTRNIVLNTSQIKEATAEIEEAERLVGENENARIRATKSILQGTRITIAGDYILVHQEMIHCEFRRVHNELRSYPI